MTLKYEMGIKENLGEPSGNLLRTQGKIQEIRGNYRVTIGEIVEILPA